MKSHRLGSQGSFDPFAECLRRGRVTAELRSEGAKQSLSVRDVEALDTPDDLVFAGRCIEDKIWCG